MQVLELGTCDAVALKLFGDVARSVYENDPVWAGASEMVFGTHWSRQLAQPSGTFLPVVVMENDRPIARAVAILTKGAVGDDGEPQGYIGFFECVENRPDAACLVLEHSEQILRTAGAQSIQAPKVDNQLFGCQISEFALPHICLTQHNPPYYRNLFEAVGYAIKQHVYSLYFTRETVGEVTVNLPGFTTRVFERSRLEGEIERFHRLQLEIFDGRPGYIPRTLAEDRAMIEAQLPIIDDELIIFAEDERGEPVGILICFPDFYQALAGQKIDRARIISIGAIPKHVNKGLGTLMGAHLMKNLLQKKQYVFAEGSVILANNIAPQNLAKRFHSRPGRRFVVLEKKL
jgi:hypothetical protein